MDCVQVQEIVLVIVDGQAPDVQQVLMHLPMCVIAWELALHSAYLVCYCFIYSGVQWWM